MKIYTVGSLRRDGVEQLSRHMRMLGHEVFDEWRAAGPHADDEWRDYFKRNGMTFRDALRSPFVHHILDFDKQWLDWADVVVVYGPAGLSSAVEMFYAATQGKTPVLYLEQDPERWDAMLLLIEGLQVVYGQDELEEVLCQLQPKPPTILDSPADFLSRAALEKGLVLGPEYDWNKWELARSAPLESSESAST